MPRLLKYKAVKRQQRPATFQLFISAITKVGKRRLCAPLWHSAGQSAQICIIAKAERSKLEDHAIALPIKFASSCKSWVPGVIGRNGWRASRLHGWRPSRRPRDLEPSLTVEDACCGDDGDTGGEVSFVLFVYMLVSVLLVVPIVF